MKKILIGAVIIASTMTAANAAETGHQSFPYWYLGLGGGVAMQKDSNIGGSSSDINWDTGSVLSASLGYQHPSLAGFRPEVEYSYRQQDFPGGNGRVNVVAGNLYYDFHNSSVVTPYVGGGLGWGHFDLKGGPGGSNVSGSNDEAIFQGMVGLGYEPISIPNVGLSLGYRYLGAFDRPEANGHKYEYDNHSVEAGAKFRF